jgi:hypothetical protein
MAVMVGADKYEVFLKVSGPDDDRHLYMAEHWFADRPGVDTVKALLEEAKSDFAVLYPEVEADDFSVEVRRLRPEDVGPASRTGGG